MKSSLFIVAFFIGFFIFPAGAQQEDSYVDSLFAEEELEVNCDNILNVLQSYFDLSGKNSDLLGVAASRLSSALSASRLSSALSATETDQEKLKQMKEEVSGSAFLIQENQFILSDKSFAIMEVLPDCLKKQ